MFTCVRKHCKITIAFIVLISIATLITFTRKAYSNADFGKNFGTKAVDAENRIASMSKNFNICAGFAHSSPLFLQSIVFPEVMRYNTLKDGIETESLRTLYTEFGEDYANFSIGIFQMKPGFAEEVETMSALLLNDSIINELQLTYHSTNKRDIRALRVERLQDSDYQLIYLTAFVLICNKIYAHKIFSSEAEKLSWYATVYNEGFHTSAEYMEEKIQQQHFYLTRNMPGKKFRYAAIAGWYYCKHNSMVN